MKINTERIQRSKINSTFDRSVKKIKRKRVVGRVLIATFHRFGYPAERRDAILRSLINSRIRDEMKGCTVVTVLLIMATLMRVKNIADEVQGTI